MAGQVFFPNIWPEIPDPEDEREIVLSTKC